MDNSKLWYRDFKSCRMSYVFVVGLLIFICVLLPQLCSKNIDFKTKNFASSHDLRGMVVDKDTTLCFLLEDDEVLSWRETAGYVEWSTKKEKNYVLAYGRKLAKNVVFDETGGMIVLSNGKKVNVVFLKMLDKHVIDYIPIDDVELKVLLAGDEVVMKNYDAVVDQGTMSWKTNYGREIVLVSKNSAWLDDENCFYFSETNAKVRVLFTK